MKDFYIADATRFENQVITTSFVVVSKQAKPKKNGELYLALTLGDRTGHIDAKMWDNVADHIDCFEQDDFVKVRGLINKFNGRFQLTLHKVRSMEEAEVDFTDYLPRTTKDVDVLWRTLGEFMDSVRDPHLNTLLKVFMADPQIEHAYNNAPAAKTLHHAFIGGLLDHVVSLCTLCDLACRNYPETINRDLLLTGAFLHDIGKVHELSFARSFSYTTRGQLLGHMIIELEMLHEKLAQVPGSIMAGMSSAVPRCPCFLKPSCCTTWTTWIPRWRACAPTSSVSRSRNGQAIIPAWNGRCLTPKDFWIS